MATQLQNRSAPSDDDAGQRQSPASEQTRYDREFGDIAKNYDKETARHPLGEREAAAAKPQSGGGGKDLTPSQLKSAEGAAGGGFYKPTGEGADHPSLKTKLKGFSARRKTFAALGAGGIVGIILTIITVVIPQFRIPSAMSLITSVTGEAAEEIVENRAQRMVIGYLITKAGGSPGNWVITDSILDTLWATFRTNRLENKIARQTGIRLERGGDGVVRVVHDGRNLDEINCRGAIRQKTCVDRVQRLLNSTPQSRRDLRKIVRLSVPAWRFMKASKFSQYLRIKYGIPRFGTPEKDKSKTDQENLEKLRTQQIDATLRNTVPVVGNATTCILDDENCDRFNENNEPIDTRQPAGEGGHRAAGNQVAEDFNEAADEARTETIKNGGSLTTRITQKLLTKLVGSTTAKVALKAIPVVGWIDLGATLNHMTYTIQTNQIAGRIPSILASAALGAQYAQWQGYGDELKAGRMDPLYVGALTTQMNGTNSDESTSMASSYKFAAGEDPGSGIPVETRVNDNLQNPRDELVANIFRVKRFADPLEGWYYTVGFLFRAAEDFIGWLIAPAVDAALSQFDAVMRALFGENWQEELMSTIIDLMMKLFGISVDPLASGAKLFNQLYAGSDVAYNSFCKTNLGCRATSEVHETSFFDTPVTQHQMDSPSLDDKKDLAALPLSDRLFSLEEPYSLANEAIRAMPVSNSPADWLISVFRQAAALPAKLFSTLTGTTHAYHGTPEEKAAIAGVRQYGATAQDLDQDIAEQVRQQSDPECPENDPENTFNLCQADKEIAGSLMCVYTDCPEFQVGSTVRPGTENGLLANLRQLFTPHNNTATVETGR